MDFDQVRIYQPGDDVRSIDWRITARTQTPHTKIFSEERERPILVITDLRSPMFFGSKRLSRLLHVRFQLPLLGRDYQLMIVLEG